MNERFIKSYHIEVPYNSIISIQNFIQIYHVIQNISIHPLYLKPVMPLDHFCWTVNYKLCLHGYITAFTSFLSYSKVLCTFYYPRILERKLKIHQSTTKLLRGTKERQTGNFISLLSFFERYIGNKQIADKPLIQWNLYPYFLKRPRK
jgi:hypothetical protein